MEEHMLKWLSSASFIHYFQTPVAYVELGLHDYLDIIHQPMDLDTIKSKCMNGDEFITSVRLVWSNAMLYNPTNNPVHKMASNLSNVFEKKLKVSQFAKAVDHAKLCYVYGAILNSLSSYTKDNICLADMFNRPIDFFKLNLSEFDYKMVISKVLCLEDIQKNLFEGFYTTVEDVEFDISLVFDNAIYFNKGNFVETYANAMKQRFEVLCKACRNDVHSHFFVTFEMRHHLQKNVANIDCKDRLCVTNLLRDKYPICLHETITLCSIDFDALNQKAFVLVDTKVRFLLVKNC